MSDQQSNDKPLWSQFRSQSWKSRTKISNSNNNSADGGRYTNAQNKHKKNHNLSVTSSGMKKTTKNFNTEENFIGLVSRGEDSCLKLDENERERFFKEIQKQFILYVHSIVDDDIETLLDGDPLLKSIHGIPLNVTITQPQLLDHVTKKPIITLDHLFMNLRKLREVLISSKFTLFSKEVFLFSMRLSAVYGNYQNYIPSIKYLLTNSKFETKNNIITNNNILNITHLMNNLKFNVNEDNKFIQIVDSHNNLISNDELIEIITIYVIHLIHFNNNDNVNDNDNILESLMILNYYKDILKFNNDHYEKLWIILKSWIDKDYYNWFTIYKSYAYTNETNVINENNKFSYSYSIFKIMDFGKKKMALEALSKIGSSYFFINKSYLEDLIDYKWSQIVDDLNCKWRDDGVVITIRERKSKK